MDAHERILLRARRKAARHAESQAWRRRAGSRSVSERNLSSTPEIPGSEIAECLGLVSVTVARANNALRDVATAWRDTFGGRMGAFGKLADEARVEALAALRDEAGRRGASAVVGVRIDVTAPTTSVLVVTVSGTAVTLAEDEAAPAGDTAADESPAEDDADSGPSPLEPAAPAGPEPPPRSPRSHPPGACDRDSDRRPRPGEVAGGRNPGDRPGDFVEGFRG